MPELKVKFNQKYDYKRANYKDPKVINNWFRLVANIKVKYGIPDDNIYNFNKSGFMMGVILIKAVIIGFKRRN